MSSEYSKSVYVFLQKVRHAYRELDQVSDEFKTARTIAQERMGAAPAVRDEISEITTQLVTAAVSGGQWYPASRRLHRRDVDRVENPTDGSTSKETTLDAGVARKEQ